MKGFSVLFLRLRLASIIKPEEEGMFLLESKNISVYSGFGQVIEFREVLPIFCYLFSFYLGLTTGITESLESFNLWFI